ncbi:MAG: hypothetical protein EBR82_81785 [Caulobacteraceae bacterium]|nr:hypothetical protein [Caulobacteraceae bacterium]
MSAVATFKPAPCCDRPAIATMDHVKGYHGDEQRMVNRCCTRCYAHWYGPEDGEVRRYSRAEWDAWVREGGLK